MSNENSHTTADISVSPPAVRKITPADLKDVLAKGFDDFKAKPSHIFLLVLIYPLVGLLTVRISFGYDVLYLVFPVLGGFALIGPVAAIGLYELSRRREQGLEISWAHAFGVFRQRSFPSLLILSVVLGVIYFAWLGAAHTIHWITFGSAVPQSIPDFVLQVLTTSAGWTMIILGCGVGFIFALIVLAISAVSFPMLLDRNVGIMVAVQTSVNAYLANPKTMSMWGIIVAGSLAVGMLLLLVGLAVVMPVLGHATWHLYRKVVVYRPEGGEGGEFTPC